VKYFYTKATWLNLKSYDFSIEPNRVIAAVTFPVNSLKSFNTLESVKNKIFLAVKDNG